jgi:hypothetical protein
VHEGPDAQAVARDHDANAVTIGKNVYLGEDAPDARTSEGKALLAHELTHVAQQNDSSPARLAPPTEKGDRWESEADNAARAVRSGRAPPRAAARSPARVARDDTTGTKLDPRAALEKKYGVKISAGDRDWSGKELEDLDWALGRLDKKELAAMSGYDFKRWTTKDKRLEIDKDYSPPAGVDECGFHELTLGGTNTARISMYDECFDPDTKMGDTPFGRFTLLHEIGHAMESAAARAQQKTVDKLSAAYDTAYDTAKADADAAMAADRARNALVAEYNDANEADKLKLKPKMDKAVANAKMLWEKADAAKAKVDPASKARDAAVDARKALLAAPGAAFGDLTKGEEALSPYSSTGPAEAFAEAFALYKADPAWLRKRNRKLHDWFAKHGPLTAKAP